MIYGLASPMTNGRENADAFVMVRRRTYSRLLLGRACLSRERCSNSI